MTPGRTYVALDTSVAVPALLRRHPAHTTVRAHLGDRPWRLTAHSAAETYSVLTRAPGDARVAPLDAARLMRSSSEPPALLPAEIAGRLPDTLAPLHIAGGAVYDALVGLAAREAGLPLLTRDARALATYAAVGVDVELIGS